MQILKSDIPPIQSFEQKPQPITDISKELFLILIYLQSGFIFGADFIKIFEQNSINLCLFSLVFIVILKCTGLMFFYLDSVTHPLF